MNEEKLNLKEPTPWGEEQATPLNDPDTTRIHSGDILNPGDSLVNIGNEDVSLYAEVWTDDQVISTFNQRKRAVIAAPLTVEAGGEDAIDIEAAEAFRENLDMLSMDDITDKTLNALFFGYMPQENLWFPHNGQIWLRDIKSRTPWRFVFDVESKLRMLTAKQPVRGVPTDPRYFWSLSVGAISHDNPYGLGIGYYVYWIANFKKQGLKFWLKYLEKFASPSILGKFPPNATDAERAKLLETIRALSSDYGAVVPEDMVLELLEAKRAGSADYSTFRKIIDAAISKIVLGQTMTTDDGSSNAQSRTHQKTKTDNARADSDFWVENFNKKVVAMWSMFNYPTAKPPKVSRDIEPRQATIDLAKTDVEIKKLGYELTEDKFIEKYGDGYQKIKAVSTQGEEDEDFKPVSGNELDETDDDNPEEFAEAFADQDLLDQAIDTFIDNESGNVSEEMLTDLLMFASQHTAKETLEELPKLIGDKNFVKLEEGLTGSMTSSAALGRVND